MPSLFQIPSISQHKPEQRLEIVFCSKVMSASVLRSVWKWIYNEIFNSSVKSECKGNKTEVRRVFSLRGAARRLLGLCYTQYRNQISLHIPKKLNINFWEKKHAYWSIWLHLFFRVQMLFLAIFIHQTHYPSPAAPSMAMLPLPLQAQDDQD